MSSDYRGTGGSMAGGDYQVPRYSRSAGITSYKRRRRRSRAFKIVVGLILVAIIGSAAVLFGRSFFDYGALPFDIPALPNHLGTSEGESAAVPKSPAKMTVAAVGDVIMNSAVVESGAQGNGTYNFDHLFRNLTHELVTFDLRTVSQETALAGSTFGFGADWPLNAPQELGRAEVASGFNVILHATDHTLDTGYDGVHNELAWWHNEQPNTPVVGIAEPDPIANPGLSDYVSHVFTVEKDGFRIAILNHTVGVTENDRGVVSALDEAKITEDVTKARELGADMIVACPHWGTEGTTEVSEEQMTYARLYANLGVDVIVGTNPRVLQRVEVLDGTDGHKTVCYYSLGCVVSSLYQDNLLGGLAEFTLARDESGVCKVTSAVLKPIVTHRAAGTDYAVHFLSDYPDDLAWNSWDGVTAETYVNRCAEILGEGFDRATMQLTILGEAPAAPVEETPAEEAPAEETPAEETPAEETVFEEAPAEEGFVEEAFVEQY